MDAVAEVRAFNRVYTRRIGMLQEGMHGTGYPLPDARVLYELGQVDAAEVRDLRDALAMDPGFMSRVLTRLERGGLIAREVSPTDSRAHVARLTPAGRDTFAELDARSVTDTGALADQLGPAGRDALRTVRAALNPVTPTLRGPAPGDLGWIVWRHGALYAGEYGWNERAEVLFARVVADYAADHDPARERVWIADIGGSPVGCVMCVRDDDRTARLRMLLVEPHARGVGTGGMLVDACLDFAEAAGYERMVLWTNDPLAAARRLYEARGFVLESEEPHAMFGPEMTAQTFGLDLSARRRPAR